jgi:hypothetical protein
MLILISGMQSCAPAGSHYGSWTDGPQAAFTLSSNAQAQGFTENGQPVQPSSNSSPASSAIRKYCATAAPLACSLYVGKVGKCPQLAANAYSILMYERRMKQGGVTAHQAAELAVRTFEKGAQVNLDDLDYVASEAASVPDGQPPELFRDEFMQQCIDAAAQ